VLRDTTIETHGKFPVLEEGFNEIGLKSNPDIENERKVMFLYHLGTLTFSPF